MGYYEEKRRYEQEQNNKPAPVNFNKCPKCKKGIMMVVSHPKIGFRQRWVFKSFCPVCGYTIKKII